LTFAFASLLFGTLRAIKQARFEPAMPEKDTSISLLLLVTISLSFGCEKSTTGPEPFKDPRTYTWTIDTLAYPGSFQTAMRDIWGSSATDVYVVGHNDQNRGLMWHFDGSRWTDVKLSTTQGGAILGPIDLSAIFGFGANDIWAVGERIYPNPTPPPNFLDSSLIIHFDGVQWKENKVVGGRYLLSVWGSAPNDIWTCGWNGTVFHFDGLSWKRDSVPVIVPADGEFVLLGVVSRSSQQVFMSGYVHQNDIVRTTRYFLSRATGTWNVADSFIIERGQVAVKFGQNGLWVSPSGTLYSFGPNIYRWNGSSWTIVYATFDALGRMAGTSDENMFAVGDFGNVFHYNGVDWHQYRELKDFGVVYSGVWTDGKEVFVVGYTNDGGKTIILHGK